MKQFTVGQKLSTRSICDSNCIFTGIVLKRTAKTVTVKTQIAGVKRCKIYTSYNGSEEMVYPHGHFSMAPTFQSGKQAV